MTDFKLDMSGMIAIHNALRRDLTCVVQAEGRTEGSDVFERMLRAHHEIEDDFLWPVVREAVAGRGDDLALLDEMVAEHGAIEPLLESPDTFERGDTRRKLDMLVREHLTHEENDALPLIDRSLTKEQWMAFGRAASERLRAEMHVYLPWLLDGVDEDTATRVVSLLPPPLRDAYEHEWHPAWLAMDRWAPKRAAVT